MRHFLSVGDLQNSEIEKLVFESVVTPLAPRVLSPVGGSVGLLFMEASTRTRSSFALAAYRIGRHTLYLDAQETSLSKGETLADTFDNLHALGCSGFVVRASSQVDLLSLRSYEKAPILNAGDGMREHPSQALLDLATIWDRVADRSWDKLRSQKWVIVGDLKHSRVAHSWAVLADKMGMNLSFVSPRDWKPDFLRAGQHWTSDLSEALEGAVGVMALRVQKERFGDEEKWNESATRDYVSRYQITRGLVDQKDLFVLHPGPVNWGVELALDIKTHSKSLILSQVERGLHMRASLLNFFLQNS
jgi:aspartate carbamoyltransferase catalytic subunit